MIKLKKYLILIFILIILIYGCKQDAAKEKITKQRGQLIVDVTSDAETKEQIKKFKSENECKEYWDRYLSSGLFSLKQRIFIMFSPDTSLQKASAILKDYGLGGKPFNIFYEVMPDKKPNDENLIYNAGHQMVVDVRKNKEIDTVCKLERIKEIISTYPELKLNLNKN